jgi:hypothetical protein
LILETVASCREKLAATEGKASSAPVNVSATAAIAAVPNFVGIILIEICYM